MIGTYELPLTLNIKFVQLHLQIYAYHTSRTLLHVCFHKFDPLQLETCRNSDIWCTNLKKKKNKNPESIVALSHRFASYE